MSGNNPGRRPGFRRRGRWQRGSEHPQDSSDQVSMLKNFFPSSLTTRPNKLEGLPLVILSSRVLEFEGKARANPIGGSDAFFLGKLLVLPANVRPDWKVFARCKYSSLFGLVISNKEKKFYNIDSRHQCYETFFSLLLMLRTIKLECLSLPGLSSQVGKARGRSHRAILQ